MSDFLTALVTALGLVLIIEGLMYAVFPDSVRRMMAIALGQPVSKLRVFGLIAAIVGLAIVTAAVHEGFAKERLGRINVAHMGKALLVASK